MCTDTTETGVKLAAENYVEREIAAGEYAVAVAVILKDTAEASAFTERYTRSMLNDLGREHPALRNACYDRPATAADGAPDRLGNTGSSRSGNCAW